MNWKFPRYTGGAARRRQSSDDDLLAAIKRARTDATLDQSEFVTAKEMASVARKYWAASESHFDLYIRQRMDPAVREQLKILAPRKVRFGK